MSRLPREVRLSGRDPDAKRGNFALRADFRLGLIRRAKGRP